MPYEMELVVLGPDKNMQFLFDGLLSKAPSLGARVPSHRLDTHPLRDAGCLDADELLEPQVRRYAHALVIANAERSGRTGLSREEIEAEIERKLGASGWGDRARAVVVAPGVGRWALEHVYQEPWSPGTPAQATLEAVLRRRRIPQSPEFYRTLGALLVDEGEPDPAWQKIVSTLRDWFGDLFARLGELSRARELDAALDLVFDHLDDLMLSKRFADVSQILARVPVDTLDPAILVGFLTITAPARAALGAARPAFVARVREELDKRMPGGEATRVLAGLE